MVRVQNRSLEGRDRSRNADASFIRATGDDSRRFKKGRALRRKLGETPSEERKQRSPSIDVLLQQ